MTFLSGFFLAALPLVVVPVLIHWYRGRQRDEISWGAMQFLTQAATKGRSMERLEELLLMLLRVAVLAALIFALARPLVSSRWWGPGGNRELVLVVDNSMSMSRENDGFSAWDQMKDRAGDVLGGLTGSDEVHLLLAAGGGQWLTAEGIAANSAGKRQLGNLLENVEPTLGSAQLLDCLQAAIHMEPAGIPTARRIVILTDDQTQSWQLDAEGAWQQLGLARQAAKLPTSVEVVDCGLADSELENLAVMRLEASHRILRPGESVEFSTQISNLGEVPSQGSTVEWLLDEQVVKTSPLVPLKPQESSQVATSLRLAESGTFAISCRIEAEDQIALDQQESIVVEVSDQLPILLAYDSADKLPAKSAEQLLTAALGYDGERAQPSHSAYLPKVISTAALAQANFSEYRAVVLTSLPDLEPSTLERLQSFVRSGGGLWVALGEQVERSSFNRDWYDDGDGLSPLALGVLMSIGNTNEPAGTIHPPSRDHPATTLLANTNQLDIDQARIFEHWQLARSSGQGGEVSVLLESGNGSPLVVENYVGQGRVLVQAFPLGLEWSNLPQLKAYVVMVHVWLDYLTAPATARFNLSPGAPLVVSLPLEAPITDATVQLPDGTTVSLAAQDAGDAITLRYSQTQLPGLYRVALNSASETRVSIPFHVARDPQESQLRKLATGQREHLIDLANLQFKTDGQPVAPAEEQAAREAPLWGLFLWALVALLIVELLLSNLLARQRSGFAVSTT